MSAFRAYRIFNADGKIGARFENLELENPAAGEVLIQIRYSSVNYKDALAATGAGKILRRYPLTGGIDLAGSVVASSDARFRAGDEVLATGYGLGVEQDGGYAEYARVPAEWVVPLPQGITPFQAMALGTAGFTAALAVVRMEANGLAPQNGPVIVTGASGGVGSTALDILAGLGYRVSALSGKRGQQDSLRSLGASEILDRNTLELGNKPLEKAIWAGAVDTLGGEILAWLTRSMQQQGCIASIGLAAGVELHTTVMPFILRGVSLLGIDSVQCPMPLRLEVWRRLASDLHPRHLAQYTHAIEFAELPEAFAAFLEGKATGRTVVHIAG